MWPHRLEVGGGFRISGTATWESRTDPAGIKGAGQGAPANLDGSGGNMEYKSNSERASR